MKIASITAWPLTAQLTRPTWTAQESLQTRYAVLVEVKTEDGPTGYGVINQGDATRAAGFTEALRVAEFAAQSGVLIAPHTVPAIHGHLVAAFPESGYCVEALSGAATDPIGHHLWAKAPQIQDGVLCLSDDPGFGLEVNWDFVRASAA